MAFTPRFSLLLAAGLLLAGPAAASIQCDGTVSSAEGGTVHAWSDSSWLPADLAAAVDDHAAEVRWSPPAAGSPLKVSVRWKGDLWSPPTEPTSLLIAFKPARPAVARRLAAEIRAGGGEVWRLPVPKALTPQQDRAWGPPSIPGKQTGYTRISLDGSSEAGRAILAQIARGERLEITIRSGGAVVLQTTLRTSDTAARDALIAQIRTRINARDPAICTDKPRTIRALAQPAAGATATYQQECVGPDGKVTVKSVILDKPPAYDLCR